MKSIIVGTAGHIDHGKSTLIKALTGIDPDRLKEEKERGITIDIGFASLQLEESIQIGFVDVPGHERFIKNMLAGIGGIDAVLLIVAADESIMPQTREHFDICSLLEIQTGAVVITKSDLVDPDILDLVRLELQEYLQNSFLRNAPMIPVSVVSGLGLKELKAALLQMAQTVPAKNANTIFRLPIDRCFTLHGFGTVVTGTLVSGRIDKDAEVEIYPTGKKSRIRSIQVHGQTVDHASAGQRTALNLQGVEVPEIQRGMELSVPGRFRPAATVDTIVHLLESSPTSLRNRARVRFHHGTSEIMATLSPIDAREILPGQTGYARIILEHPILAVVGDKFILRRTSPLVTIGGGKILDTQPPARVRKNLEGTVEFLKAMQSKDLKESILQLAKRNGITGLDEDQILSRTLVQPCTLRQIFDELASANRLNLLSKAPFQVMDTEAFDQLSKRTLEVIGQFHRDEPLSLGMSKEQLYSAIFRGSPHSTFKTVMDLLSVQGRIVIEQDRVRLPGRTVTLNQEEFSAKQQIEEAFLKAGWKVPDLEEVLSGLPVPRDQAKRLVLLLTKEKKLIKLSENLFFHADPIAQLKKLLTEYKKKSDRIDVGAFKNLTDISRKFAIPLLEYLDRERITRRVGESRLIL